MKQTVLMVLLMAMPAAPALGEPEAPAPLPAASKDSSLASQDPLMRQILYRQISQRNGGITAAVRVASGQSIELQLPDADVQPAEELKDALDSGSPAAPLAGLKPIAGLAAAQDEPMPSDGAKALKPSSQLELIDKSRKDWGEGSKTKPEKLPYAEPGPVSLD